MNNRIPDAWIHINFWWKGVWGKQNSRKTLPSLDVSYDASTRREMTHAAGSL